MSLYKQFKSDAELENEGRWFDIKTPNEDGSFPGFRMKRTGTRNIAYQRAMEKLGRERKVEIDTGTLAPDEALEILVDTFVETAMVDWRNVYDENDVRLPYSKASAHKLFTELPDLFTLLRQQAGLLSNYQDKIVKAASGN